MQMFSPNPAGGSCQAAKYRRANSGEHRKRLLLRSPPLTLRTTAAYWPATPARGSRSRCAVVPAVTARKELCSDDDWLTSSQRTVLSLSAAAGPSCKPKERHGPDDSETIQQTGWCGLLVMSFVYSRSTVMRMRHLVLAQCFMDVVGQEVNDALRRKASKYFKLCMNRSVNVWMNCLFLNCITPKVFCYHLYKILYFEGLYSSVHLHLLL